MKNIFIITLLLFAILLEIFPAGRIAEIWTQPAVFKADEPVTWYFDVSGTDLDGEQNGIYLWSWYPSEPDAGNWSNPSSFAALTQVEGNIWKIDLTPTIYYGMSADQISAFYGLLKNADGSKVTDAFAPDQEPPNDIQVYDLATIKGTAVLDYFPKDFSADRPLSVLINANNTWSKCNTSAVQGDLINAANIHMHGGVNDWDIVVENNQANLTKTQMTHLGDGVYRIDFIPSEYFDLPDNYILESINMVFADDSWTYEGKDSACADFFILAPEEPELPTPVLTFLPQKISRKDLLVITRTDNGPDVNKLSYTITAGSKTIKGDFEGNNASMSAYIDLVTNLKDVTNIEKINIVIKDNNGVTITDTDITLVNPEN